MIIILGFSSTDKVPGFYAETKFGAGGISFGSLPMYLLLTGNMLTGGASTPDFSVDDIPDEQTAITNYVVGSELHRMCRAALRIPGIRIKASPVLEASAGPAAATATLTVTVGTISANGSFYLRVAGDVYHGGVLTSDTPTSIALNVANLVNNNPRSPVSATPVAGVVTFTTKQRGVRFSRGVLWYDKGSLCAGVTFAVAGGASVATNGCYFTGGAGADSVANVLAVIFPGRYNRIATAEADATNAALWKTQINNKAGVLEGRTEHVVMASNDTQVNAKSIAQATLNDQRFQMLWLQNTDTYPSEMAATFAALRTQYEQANPNSGYDGVVIPGVNAQLAPGDVPSRATIQSSLDNGLTPLQSQSDGTVTCVRSITTHSLSGSNPDYSCLDTSAATTPDAMRDVLRIVWLTQFLPANPYVRREPSPNEPRPPSGQAYPSLWNAEMVNQLRIAEQANWVTAIESNMPISDYDNTAQRIMAICPVVPLPIQHQIGVSVRGTVPS